MKMTIKHENDEFLGITLKHVPGLKVALNSPRTIKLWEIAHENGHKTRKRRVSGHALKHVSCLAVMLNRPGIPKIWAITHENSQNTRK